MRKLTALLVMLLAVSGCEKLEETLGVKPTKTVGRYQLHIVESQNSANQAIYILDTMTGAVWRKFDGSLYPDHLIFDDMIKGD